jgi:WD40 repeat protein
MRLGAPLPRLTHSRLLLLRSIRIWAEEPGTDDWACVQALPGAAAAAKEAAAAARQAAKASGKPSDPDEVAAAAADAAAAAALACGGHTSSVWAVAFRPDGARMASVSDDGSMRFWDTAAGAPARFLGAVQDAHARAIFAADWAPDAAHVATAGGDNALRVWAPAADGAGAALVAEAAPAHAADVNAVRWHPTRAGWLATGADDGTVKVWALEGDDAAAAGSPDAMAA